MPITARLLEKANSSPNSGVGSRSIPDAPINLLNGYTLSGNTVNWTSASVHDTRCLYLDYVNSASVYGPGLSTDVYYYNSTSGLGIGTQLYRSVNGNYNNPTNPTTGNWVYVPGSPSTNPVLLGIYVPSVITISGSIITSITSFSSLYACGSPTPTPTPIPTDTPTPTPTSSATPTPTPTSTPTATPTATPSPTSSFTSSVAINLCAPISGSSNMVIYAYAVTGSNSIVVNTGVSASFYWSGSAGELLSGSLIIPSGSTCTSSSISTLIPGQTVVSFTYSGSINPSTYWTLLTGTYNYLSGSAITSGSCPSCP